MRTLSVGMTALAVLLLMSTGGAWATVQFLGDGAVQNNQGGWDLPAQGTCPADLTQTTRPDCLALRLNIVQASCTGNYSWTTSGVCNDLVNTTQGTCEAQPGRLWNAGTGVCAITLYGDDRNNVECALQGGTWVTTGTCIGNWIMPARTAYTPALLTGTGPGDQCLRCHNSETQYNGPRVRDVENYLFHGHKNMARKVTVGMPWGGPPFACSVNPTVYTDEETCEDHGGTWDPTIYPSNDTGDTFDWGTGRINAAGGPFDMVWIYGDWLSPLPRAIYKAPASTSQVCTDPRYSTSNCVANGGSLVNNAGMSYSCGRCHTTGWTSDATIVTSTGIEAKEPEESFPGITWDRNTNAPSGVVNLSGGVTGDPNKYSSWDVWGITCTRCHSSAIDTTTGNASTPPQYSSPTGMSSHHSRLTAADVSAGSGYCTDSRFTAQAQCDAAGAAWLTACSVAGACSLPAYTTSGTCAANAGTWTVYDQAAICTTNGGTFYTSSCNMAGVCNDLDPAHNTQVLCEGAGAQWAAATDIVRCLDIHEFGKENGIPEYAAAAWTGSATNRGQIITRLCMDCHRQETGGLPYDGGAAPGTALKVGPAHGDVAFVSHYHGNQYLNSPHGKFSGTFNDIATGKFSYAMTGQYKSFFMVDGEAANTGNGCTGCHSIHNSTVEKTGPDSPFAEECTECHAKNLNLVNHPKQTGTPLENMATDPMEACEICHMPGGEHLFRINTDPAYSTFPATALTATVNANTAPDGTWTNAVWVDLDAACGQCHGGGSNHVEITGNATAGNKVITVADTTGFVAGQRISIAGAGSLTYDEIGEVVQGDFESYIVSVDSATGMTLVGGPTYTVTGAAVIQNPTKNGAGYMDKATLAGWAKGMHNDKPMVTFAYTIGSPNTLMINVDASATLCSGSNANCDAYDWNWGDGSPDGSGKTASHTYALAGSYTITLTVEEYGVGGASATRNVNASTPDLPPTAVSACVFDADQWILTLTDASTDDFGIKQVTVNWGDGTVISNDTTAPFGPFSHTFLNKGTYTVTHKAIDTIGQQATSTCVASPAYFTIGGTVYTPAGVGSPLAGATVIAKKGGVTAGSAFTAANGTFTIANLKPGTYTLTVTRYGYTFTVPAATLAVGPASGGNVITALTGPMTAPKNPSLEGKRKHGGKDKGKNNDGGVTTPVQ